MMKDIPVDKLQQILNDFVDSGKECGLQLTIYQGGQLAADDDDVFTGANRGGFHNVDLGGLDHTVSGSHTRRHGLIFEQNSKSDKRFPVPHLFQRQSRDDHSFFNVVGGIRFQYAGQSV